MTASTPRFHPQQEGFYRRYKVTANGRTMFCFNPGQPLRDWLDFTLKRPCIHPLYTPSGIPLTEQGAHNFPHHKACWTGHALVNGINFYHDSVYGGLILARKVDWSEKDGVGILDADIEWVNSAFEVVLNEKRRHWVRPGAQANRIDIRSEITTPLDKAEFAVEKHAFFHIRVIEAISEGEGGKVRASNGIDVTEKIFKSHGVWIDSRGEIGGRKVGACIMAHPDDGPQPLFARPYGTIALNPFFEKPMTLPRGQTYRRTYSVIAYDGELDVEAAYNEFGATKFE